MLVVDKKEVSNRIKQIIKEKFGGIDVKLSQFAKLTPSTLQRYINGESIPGGENLARLAQAGCVTTDWILLGPDEPLVSEAAIDYVPERFTAEEKEVIEEYRAASEKERETGRMVFRMNAREQKKTNHPLRRKTDRV